MFELSLPIKFGHRILCICLLIVGLFSARPSQAEDAEPLENRFLFVIETSASMSRSADAVQGAVANILRSEMQGQLRPGDTVGVWTYSDNLNTDFPMQVWSTAQKKNILDAISAHLHSVRYAKKGRLDRVWPDVVSVMKSSRTLTVFLIHDGAEPIKGTRFDGEINDLQKDYQPELRSANLPFVTVLAARNGEFFEYTVNSPSSAIRIPHTAEPAKKPEVAVQPTNAPAVKPREIRRIVIAPPIADVTPPAAPVSPATNAATPAKADPVPVPAAAPNPAPALPVSAQPIAPVSSNPPTVTAPTGTFPATNASPSVESANVEAPPPPVAERQLPAVATPEKTTDKVPSTVSTPVAESKNPMTLLLVIACGLLVVAVGIIIYLLRYLNRRDQASLISQSMKRDGGR